MPSARNPCDFLFFFRISFFYSGFQLFNGIINFKTYCNGYDFLELAFLRAPNDYWKLVLGFVRFIPNPCGLRGSVVD